MAGDQGKAGKPNLDAMLAQLLDAAAVADGEGSSALETLSDRWVGESKFRRSGEVRKLAGALFEALGPNSAFEDRWDVLRFALDRLKEAGERSSQQELRAFVIQGLQNPLRPYPFELDLLSHVPFPMKCSIGGERELTLSTRAPSSVGDEVLRVWKAEGQIPEFKVDFARLTDHYGAEFVNELAAAAQEGSDARKVLRLTGITLASTEESAVIRVERIVDELLGALRALKLLAFVEGRDSLQSLIAQGLFQLKHGVPLVEWQSGAIAATPLATVYTERLRACRLQIPTDLSDTERVSIEKGEISDGLARRFRLLTRVLAGSEPRAAIVRNACRLAINAEHSLEFGVTVTLAFSCLEGLLLPHKDIGDKVASLKEAVAHLIGGSFEEKELLRKTVKNLYDLRSIFAHTGRAAETGYGRTQVLSLMYRVLRKEIEQLPDVPSGASGTKQT